MGKGEFMQDYGPIFKEFRINRGFSLKQIACDDLSISQLSRFERGESNISLNKFLLALQTIQLSLDEFMNRANNYKKTGTEEIYVSNGCLPLSEGCSRLGENDSRGTKET